MSTQTTSKWAIDASHSTIGFKVKHLMISNVSGKFDKFEGTLENEGDDFSTAKASFIAQAASINTNEPQRDGHLQSPDFLNAAEYPQIRFTSTKFEKTSGNNYTVTGDLTIRDVTKPVKLDVEFSGFVKDAYGNNRAAFEITGKVNRLDYGLKMNIPLDGGGVVIGEDVKFEIDVQLIKQV